MRRRLGGCRRGPEGRAGGQWQGAGQPSGAHPAAPAPSRRTPPAARRRRGRRLRRQRGGGRAGEEASQGAWTASEPGSAAVPPAQGSSARRGRQAGGAAQSCRGGCRGGGAPEPGFSVQAAGRLTIMWPPVSVWNQVSTTAHLPSPTTCGAWWGVVGGRGVEWAGQQDGGQGSGQVAVQQRHQRKSRAAAPPQQQAVAKHNSRPSAHVVVPAPGLGVDGLAHRPQHAQAGAVGLAHLRRVGAGGGGGRGHRLVRWQVGRRGEGDPPAQRRHSQERSHTSSPAPRT